MLHYFRKTSQTACMPELNSTLLYLQIGLKNSNVLVNYTHLVLDHFQTISCKIVELLRKNKAFCPPSPHCSGKRPYFLEWLNNLATDCRTLISRSGMSAAAAVVAAPMGKLWDEYPLVSWAFAMHGMGRRRRTMLQGVPGCHYRKDQPLRL